MKFLVRCALVIAMALGGLTGYSFTVGKETTVGVQTQEVIGKVQYFFAGALPKDGLNFDWLKWPGKKDDVIQTYQPVLKQLLKEMFFENRKRKTDQYFSLDNSQSYQI